MNSIHVSAVVLRDSKGKVLTVRKRGTSTYMFPGGKLEPGETSAEAAIRECREELGVDLDERRLRSLGTFEAVAANEPGQTVVASVFEHPYIHVGEPEAEIAELKWAGLTDEWVAPLLREAVFPALRSWHGTNVTVFTGSATGDSPLFTEATKALASTLASFDIGVVYGGGHVGLMGVLADAALEAGGTVHGVMPQALVDGEIAHSGLTSLEVVPDMHARKRRMLELGDTFVALPGGTGTLEELFEAWTWQQLGMHNKPVALYDVDGYWQPLLVALTTMAERGFLSERFLASLIVADTPEGLLADLHAWRPRPSKW